MVSGRSEASTVQRLLHVKAWFQFTPQRELRSRDTIAIRGTVGKANRATRGGVGLRSLQGLNNRHIALTSRSHECAGCSAAIFGCALLSAVTGLLVQARNSLAGHGRNAGCGVESIHVCSAG